MIKNDISNFCTNEFTLNQFMSRKNQYKNNSVKTLFKNLESRIVTLIFLFQLLELRLKSYLTKNINWKR